MKKENKNILIVGILIIAVIALILMGTGVLFSVTSGTTFTPVYCNDPTGICCVKTQYTGDVTLKGTSSWQCPMNAVSCEITPSKDGLIYYSQTSPVVRQLASNLWIKLLDAPDQKKIPTTGGTTLQIPAGSYVWISGFDTITSFTWYGSKLVEFGGSTLRTDSCTYSTSTGEKITTKANGDLGISYVVPVGTAPGSLDSCIYSWTAGDRHICGNLEEQCGTDADCGGHTYGNKECTNHVLQTYGCNEIAMPSKLTQGFLGQATDAIYEPIGTNPTTLTKYVTARCEIKSAVQVQCCGDADCGSNAVCDTTTFTCKAPTEVPCTRNSQCGVSTQCDFSTLKLKTPICSAGKCGYSAETVECCNDAGCAREEFCNNDYECQLSDPNVKKQCPFECCVGIEAYFDRACLAGSYCDGDACVSEPLCKTDTDCDINHKCTNGECVLKEQVCEAKIGGLVTGNVETTSSCGFLGLRCVTGSPKVTTECKYDYTLVIIFAIIALAIALAFILKKKGKK
jgi:hypothetical protein